MMSVFVAGRFRRFAALFAILALTPAAPAQNYTWTSAGTGTATNPVNWSFGAGPFPASDAAGNFTFVSYGQGTPTVNNDLNLTLQTLTLGNSGSGSATLASLLSGNFAFSGNAVVNQVGSGSGGTTITAPVVIGSTATGLTFQGAGFGNLTISGALQSNVPSPLVGATINRLATAPNASLLTLGGTNNFTGPLTLNSGNIAVGTTGSLGSFGASFNTVTVNGGALQSNATILNPFVVGSGNRLLLSSTATTNVTTFGNASGLGLGGIGGAGNLEVRPAGNGQTSVISVPSGYTGTTTIGKINFAPSASPDNPGGLRINGASGSILGTSAVNIRDGAALTIDRSLGDSLANNRINAAAAINVASGFLQTLGGLGLTGTNYGTVNAGGLTTILAQTQTAASTVATIANLNRVAAGTVTFTGTNLGNGAAIVGSNNANILLTQIDGAAPSAALVGGGGAAASSTISILPYALGDTANTTLNFGAGSGFVTYDTFGVRLLNATTEYVTTNNFTTLVGTTNNVRIGGAITNPTANTTINSLFVASSGQTLAGGSNIVTITSGALASNVAAFTTSSPLAFGAGGTGEAIIGTIGAFGTGNTITANGALTGSTLTKSGHGTLVLGSTANAFSSNTINVNGGFLTVASLSNFGIANSASSSIAFSMHAYLNRGGINYGGTAAETLNVPLTLNAGHTVISTTTTTADLTLAGQISGAGGLNFNTSSTGSVGIIRVTGINSFTGGVRLGPGNTFINADSAFGASSGFLGISAANGTLHLAGNWTTSRSIGLEASLGTAGSRDGFNTAGFNAAWGGTLVGSATIVKVDSSATPGTWTITGGDNPFSGTIQLGNNATVALPGGTLALSGAGALSSANIVFGPASTSTGAAGVYVLDLSNATGPSYGPGVNAWRSFASITQGTAFDKGFQIVLGSSVNPVDLRLGAASGGTTLGNTAAATNISGFGNVVKVGQNVLTLTAPTNPYTFTGNVEIWGGTLVVGGDGALGNSANSVGLYGGTFTNSAVITTARNFVLGATPTPVTGVASPNIFATLGSLTINGTISGAGGFEKTTASQDLVLSGANNFAGNIRISGGTVAVNADAALGAPGNVLILNGGILRLTSGSGNQTINRTTIATVSSSISTLGSDTLTMTGPFIGSATVNKVGSGNLILNNPSPLFTGTLDLGSGGVVGSTTLGVNASFPRSTLSLTASSSTVNASNPNATPLTREFATVNTAVLNDLALGSTNPIAMVFGFNNTTANTWAGGLTGGVNASITKLGAATWSVTGTIGTSGGLTLAMGQTTFGSGAISTPNIPFQSSFTVGAWGDGNNIGAGLTLSYPPVATNRIDDGQDVYLNNVGNGDAIAGFTFTNSGSFINNEVFLSLRGAGYSTITMTTGGTLSATDASNGLTRVDRGTFLIRGAIGTGAASATVGNVLFGNSAALGAVGGTGTPVTEFSIIPYIAAGSTPGSTGNTFATYGANGIRPLDTTNEYVASFTGVNGSSNVRFAPALTTILAADTTINSWILPGTINSSRFASTATEKVIVNSGAIMNTISQIYGVTNTFTSTNFGIHVSEIQTGALNTRELIFHVQGTGVGLNVGSLISTTGGLTKSGAGNLFLTRAANTYTGGTTVNAGNLFVDSLSAINDSAAQQLTLSGGFLKYRGASATLAGPVKLGGGSATNVGSTGGLHIASGTTLTIPAGQVTGFGGLMKDGTGTLVLTGDNNYSGATILAAGTLAIGTPGALGTNSRVVFGGSNVTGTSSGAKLQFNAPMTVTQDFITATATATVGFNFDTAGNDVILTGVISSPNSTRGLTKFGTGDLRLTATNLYTGPTQVYGGSLTFGGANGSALLSTGGTGYNTAGTFVVGPQAALVLDNAAAANSNRLPDVFSVPTGSADSPTATGLRIVGGEFKIRGNATTPINERINRVDQFYGTVTLENLGRNVTLTSGRVNRLNNAATALVRGTNLGDPVSASSTNWFALDQGSGSIQLGGAGGAAGTPFINIVPGFIGDRSATGVGTDLMTYDARVGFRLLAANEYATSIPAFNLDTSRAPNLQVSGSLSAPNASSYVTAIKLNGGTLNASSSINLAQSTILSSGASTINVPVIQSLNNTGYVVHVSDGTLTLNSALNGATVTKAGPGTLELRDFYYGTGQIIVAGGTLRLGGNGGLNPIGSTLSLTTGATFDLGGADRTISALSALTTGNLIGSFQLGAITEGTVTLGSNRLTLFDITNGTFSGQFTGNGSVVKPNFSSGTFTLTQPQPSFTGTFGVYAGSLILADQGALPNASLVDVRGGSLTFTNTNDLAGASGYVATRIGAGTTINLGGGTLTVTGNADAITAHTLGTVNLVGGATIAVTPGAAAPATLTINNLNRAANRGTLTMTGTNLGLPLSPIGGSNLFATQIDGAAPSAALVGGGGVAGTTTVSILPWAWNSTTSTLVTYGANGFRPLDVTAEYLNTFTGALPTTNIRFTGAGSLTADTSVNSFSSTAGGLGGAFNLTIGSGAIVSSATQTLGATGTNFLTGAGNTRDLVVNTTTGTTTINANVTTTGSLVKFGSGTLTLSGTNTFGGLAVNDGLVNFASDANLGAPGAAISFGGTNSVTTPRGVIYTNTTAGVVNFNRPMILNAAGGFAGNATRQVLTLGGVISGPGALVLHGNGAGSTGSVIELDAANTYTGQTVFFVDGGSNSLVSIRNDASLGNGGSLLIDTLSASPIIQRGNWSTSRTIRFVFSYPVNTNGYAANWNGFLNATSGFVKDGAGALTIAAPGNFGGVTVAGGDLVLGGRGATSNIGNFTMNAGTRLILDDSITRFSDRIPDNGGTLIFNNSEFQYLGNASGTSEELINGATAGASGLTTFTIGGASTAKLWLVGSAPLARSTSSGILFRGANLGVNTFGTPNSNNIGILTPSNLSTPTLVGGGGLDGSTAKSVIAGAFVDTNSFGFGNAIATYDLARGIRGLSSSEFYAGLTNGTVTQDNVRQIGTSPTIGAGVTVNTLWLDGASVAGVGTITVAAGQILATGNSTVAAPMLSTNALVFGGPGDVTLATSISGAHSVGVIKLGSGTLTLATANTFGGGITLGSGTVAAGNATALGGGTMTFRGGAVANVSGGPLTIANPFVIAGPVAVAGSQSLTFSAGINLGSATRVFDITNTATTTFNGTITADKPGVGLTKTGNGLLLLQGNNTYGSLSTNWYDAQTTVNAGELRAGNVVAGANSATGGSRVVVNAGGTLSGNGSIVPQQLSQSRNTVTINNGGTISPGNGAVGTLTIGATTGGTGPVTASVLLAAASNYFFEYAGSPTAAAANTGTSLTPGTGNDLLTVNGTLTINPLTNFAIAADASGLSPASSYSFRIAGATSLGGAISITNQSQFNTAAFTGFTGTHTFDVTGVGANVFLNFTPVPEPTTILAVGGLLLGAGALRRRLRRTAA